MRKIIVAVFVVLLTGPLIPALARQDTLQQSIERNMRQMDSLNEQIRIMDSVNLERMMTKSAEDMSHNMDWFIRYQKEREAKARKQAYIRIGIGVAFAAVLVVGLLRRRKKKTV